MVVLQYLLIIRFVFNNLIWDMYGNELMSTYSGKLIYYDGDAEELLFFL